MESQRHTQRETNIRPWVATANGIHDQGVGGNCNVVKEIIYPKGAEIDIREFDWKKEEGIKLKRKTKRRRFHFFFFNFNF
jgi:hypothetical protein